MSRLIYAEEAYKYLTEYYHHRADVQHIALREALNRVPTVEAEPVKHGEWLAVKGWDDEIGELDNAECSVCHEIQESEYWAKTYYKYCPNCGAKMKLIGFAACQVE